MKVLLLIGNVTFHHLEAEELALFKTDAERKALVHSIDCIVECESEEVDEVGEEALSQACESYLIPSVFEENGEIAYECENNLAPISVEDFRKDYLS